MSYVNEQALARYHTGIKNLINSVSADTRIVEITETQPSISCLPNTLYVCGEVTSITITPSEQGVCTILFQTGSTAPTLTLPSTVLMPSWFYIEPNKIYEISIVHGIYGSAMSWEVSS